MNCPPHPALMQHFPNEASPLGHGDLEHLDRLASRIARQAARDPGQHIVVVTAPNKGPAAVPVGGIHGHGIRKDALLELRVIWVGGDEQSVCSKPNPDSIAQAGGLSSQKS